MATRLKAQPQKTPQQLRDEEALGRAYSILSNPNEAIGHRLESYDAIMSHEAATPQKRQSAAIYKSLLMDAIEKAGEVVFRGVTYRLVATEKDGVKGRDIRRNLR